MKKKELDDFLFDIIGMSPGDFEGYNDIFVLKYDQEYRIIIDTAISVQPAPTLKTKLESNPLFIDSGPFRLSYRFTVPDRFNEVLDMLHI